MYRVMHITTLILTRHTIDGVDIEPPEEDIETNYSIVFVDDGNRCVCRIEVDLSPDQADAVDAAVRKLSLSNTDGYYEVKRGGATVAYGIGKELAEAIREGLGNRCYLVNHFYS